MKRNVVFFIGILLLAACSKEDDGIRLSSKIEVKVSKVTDGILVDWNKPNIRNFIEYEVQRTSNLDWGYSIVEEVRDKNLTQYIDEDASVYDDNYYRVVVRYNEYEYLESEWVLYQPDFLDLEGNMDYIVEYTPLNILMYSDNSSHNLTIFNYRTNKVLGQIGLESDYAYFEAGLNGQTHELYIPSESGVHIYELPGLDYIETIYTQNEIFGVCPDNQGWLFVSSDYSVQIIERNGGAVVGEYIGQYMGEAKVKVLPGKNKFLVNRQYYLYSFIYTNGGQITYDQYYNDYNLSLNVSPTGDYLSFYENNLYNSNYVFVRDLWGDFASFNEDGSQIVTWDPDYDEVKIYELPAMNGSKNISFNSNCRFAASNSDTCYAILRVYIDYSYKYFLEKAFIE